MKDVQNFIQRVGSPGVQILRETARSGVYVGKMIYIENFNISNYQAEKELIPFRWYSSSEMEQELNFINENFPEYFI